MNILRTLSFIFLAGGLACAILGFLGILDEGAVLGAVIGFGLPILLTMWNEHWQTRREIREEMRETRGEIRGMREEFRGELRGIENSLRGIENILKELRDRPG